MIKIDLAYVVNLQNNISQNDSHMKWHIKTIHCKMIQYFLFLPHYNSVKVSKEVKGVYNGVRLKHFLLEQSWVLLDVNCNALMKNLPLLPLDSFLK
jgi:hypothetical protein